jgi:hypothetical protein
MYVLVVVKNVFKPCWDLTGVAITTDDNEFDEISFSVLTVCALFENFEQRGMEGGDDIKFENHVVSLEILGFSIDDFWGWFGALLGVVENDSNGFAG